MTQPFLYGAARLWLSVALLFTLYVGALHLRPYQYPDGFEVFIPEATCEPGCVLGVQPGVTRAADAARLLAAHPMVELVRRDARGSGGEIWWTWVDAYDDLKPVGVNTMWYGEDGVILGASMPTTVPLYEFRVRLGLPEGVHYTRYPSSGDVVVREDYAALSLTYSFRCTPRSSPRIYRQPVSVLVNPRNERFQFQGAPQQHNVLHGDPCQNARH
jgi:hypothetical protein